MRHLAKGLGAVLVDEIAVVEPVPVAADVEPPHEAFAFIMHVATS